MRGRRPFRVALALAITVLGLVSTASAAPFVYVMSRRSGTPRVNVLTVIDAATNTKAAQIVLGAANNFILPKLMTISPNGDRVYVANDLESTISVVSTATNTVVDTWPTALAGITPVSLAMSPDGQRLYVARQNGSIAVIDVASKTVVSEPALGLSTILGFAPTPDGSRVYATATFRDRIAVLGASPFNLLSTVQLDTDVRLLRGDTAVSSPDGRFIYLPQRPNWDDPCGSNPNCVPLPPPGGASGTRVQVLDTSTNAIVATTLINAEFFARVYDLAVSPNGAFVYTAGRRATTVPPIAEVFRLNPTTHEVAGYLSLGSPSAPPPIGRGVTFLPDSSRAYIAATDGVHVVDTATNTVTATIPFSGTDGTPNAIVASPPPPPEPPSSLRATVDGNRVTLAWDAPSTGTVAGYVLEGGATPGSVLASIPTGQNTPGFSFDAPSGAFYIRIHALGAGRRSAASNEIQILVNVPRPPSAPSGLRGLANGSDLLLSWINTTVGGTPSSLQLDVTGAITTSLSLPTSEAFSYSGVPPGTYTFTVRATNATGSSLASPPVTLTFPGTCPGAPQAPSNFTVARQGAQLTVNWDPPASGAAVSSYVLNVSGAVNLSLPVPGRTISGAVAPGSYQLSVQAVNPCGVGPVSAAQSVTVP